MSFQQICRTYRQNIQQTREQGDATAELSLHGHLKGFLEQTAELLEYTIKITHEPRQLEIGRPDFVVREGLFPLGYIEAEAYGRNLDALTGHAKVQNERFIENLDNFILTNFVEFRLYTNGTLRAIARIDNGIENLERLLDGFFSVGSMQITTPEALAKHLARRTRELRTQIETRLTDENSDTYAMFSAFKELLLSTLTPDQFADMYAQTLAYGLFAARCALPNATNFSRETAASALPQSNPFLRQLFHQIDSPNLNANITYILEDIANLLRNVPTEMLRTAFIARTYLEDPVIHFYETFLAEYNPQLRVERGVYYTPPQVISYIVRSVDVLLKTTLNRPDGLSDDNTLILDPATGTGGFLLTVLDHIREYVTTTYGTGDWNRYINAQLVKRLFGFELLVAPYTIAHLKLSLFLQAQGWQTTERLRVYLTNTLEEPIEREQRLPFAGFISDEANAAVSVKRDEPLLVILGNPPYPLASANPSSDNDDQPTFIGHLIEDYKPVDGQLLGIWDQKKSLQSDYVKFIRWAQWRIDKNGEGVVGYIVNNSFLDGLTFRRMRQSLLDSFDSVYLLNLHGSIIVEEAIPDGKEDQNVFDIEVGVAILLCVKESSTLGKATFYYADMWGNREEKYRTLLETDVQKTDWCELHPASPLYLFVPQDSVPNREAVYKHGWQLNEIFQSSSSGIVTGRNEVTVHRTENTLRETVQNFVSLSEDEVQKKYDLDNRYWKVHLAQQDLRDHSDAKQYIVPIRHRPFDVRKTYYTGRSCGFHTSPRNDIMPHLLNENIALCVCRIVKGGKQWQHILITDEITENCYLSSGSSESVHVFPLYIYENPNRAELTTERQHNLNPDFLKVLSEKFDLPQTALSKPPQGVSSEEIIAYIYAHLYSPIYRESYYEFLKYGFPHIPLPRDIEYFRKLAALGQNLIDWHLLKDVQISPLHRFEGEGDAVVSKVRYESGHVWINAVQYFTDVPAEVWEYKVGAYQVCKKWLQDRKNTPLSHAEVRQYSGILVAVGETLRIMAEIDEVLDFQ